MFLLLSAAFAASQTTPSVTATVATLTDCVERVRTDFEGGAVLPTRAKTAADGVATCRSVAEASRALLAADIVTTAQAFRAERERIDAVSKPTVQTLVGTVTNDDAWISVQLDRARTQNGTSVVRVNTTELERLMLLAERKSLEIGDVDVAIMSAQTEELRYLGLRDSLWVMACTGEITLPFGEGVPYDPRYDSTTDQCRSLLERHRDSRSATSGDTYIIIPGNARR